jgi:ubiquinone/menaquinone biosynthesis C-methylase UbiE
MKRRKTTKRGDVKSKKFWDDQAKTYDAIHDEFAKTLGGKVDEQMSWEILKENLPEDKSAKILDAGGGTGRWTLPLVKMGYQVTLSDISTGMLGVAREKLRKEGLLDRVEIREADVADLPFTNELFDFVLCWGGPLSCADSERGASELVRILKRGGKILVDVINRYYAALHRFEGDPGVAVKMAKSEFNSSPWGRILSLEEFREMFEDRRMRKNCQN